MPSAAAAEHSRLLHEVRANLDHTAVLILKAPPGKPYNGRKLWDVMLCLGLEWGDMDCFHWMNSSEVGDDSLFSVETSTPPGFFFPEELAAGTMKPADLVFLFSVPRSAAPLAVFDAMVRAMEYCRKRLGGQICDDAGNPANIREARAVIADIESQLRAAGFPPGADRTLRLF
jgi:cell division protein ZipA